MTEGVAAVVESDEAVPFCGVKPLHFAFRRGLRNGLIVAICHCEPTLLAPCRLDTPSRPASRPREGNCDMMNTEPCTPHRGQTQKCQDFAVLRRSKALDLGAKGADTPPSAATAPGALPSKDPRRHRRT